MLWSYAAAVGTALVADEAAEAARIDAMAAAEAAWVVAEEAAEAAWIDVAVVISVRAASLETPETRTRSPIGTYLHMARKPPPKK